MIHEDHGLPVTLGSHVHTVEGVAEVRAWDPVGRLVWCRLLSSARPIAVDLSSIRQVAVTGQRDSDAYEQQRRRLIGLARDVAEVTDQRRLASKPMAEIIAAMRRFMKEVRP